MGRRRKQWQAVTAETLDEGRKKILENARELVDEGNLLLDAGHAARAYCLAHLAVEEMAKIPMIVRACAEIQAGLEVDWKKLNNRLIDHKSKIRLALYMDSVAQFGLDESDEGDEELAALLHWYIWAYEQDELNNLKNQSLYVGLQDQQFVRPSELISIEKARAMVGLAKRRLAFMSKAERMIGNLAGKQVSKDHFPKVREAVDNMRKAAERVAAQLRDNPSP